MTSNGALLELDGVSKRFGPVQALDRVDFEVHAGEVVGLVGDNGAGKSTLVKSIAGIHSIDSGTIRFEGKTDLDPPAPGRDRARDRHRLPGPGAVRQPRRGREPLPRDGRRSPPASARSTSSWTRRRMEHRAGELFSGLAVTIPSLRSEVGTLSGGQRQQVAVARSLLGEPKVVLLDEPTAALGVPQTKQVLDLIRRLRERDLGVVVISHNLANVFDIADRIVVLRLGKIAGQLHSRADHRGACRLGDHRPGWQRRREGRRCRGAGRADRGGGEE